MDDQRKLLVVIDPGHTGTSYNAGAVKGYYESRAVYDLSMYEKAALEQHGIDVILTRSLYEDPELYERGQMAVRKGAGYEHVVFESNHSNAANGQACGVVVFRSGSLPKSEELGNRIAEAVVSEMAPVTGITYNRGVQTRLQRDGRDWYGVIRGAVSGAATERQAERGTVHYAYIVEHGFHDNLKECTYLSEQKHLKAIAEAKASAIAAYFQIEAMGGLFENNKPLETTISARTYPCLVKVDVENLNIRKQPTIQSEAVGFTGKGVFTIVDEMNGLSTRTGKMSRWGKLKSGRGWICLDYAKVV